VQLSFILDEVVVMDKGRRGGTGRIGRIGRRGRSGRMGRIGWRGRRGRMDLQRRLRRQHDSSAAADVNRLPQAVAGEYAWAGADEDDVRRAVEIEGATDPERRLGVGMGQNRAVAARFENELETRGAPNRGERTRIW
jgi:hypothetical protein